MAPCWFIAVMLAMPIAFGALLVLMALECTGKSRVPYLPERYPRNGL